VGVNWENVDNWALSIATIFRKWEERKKFLLTWSFRCFWRLPGRGWCH